jgi:uncharacterized membrane protein HdeD (DUF308 family)
VDDDGKAGHKATSAYGSALPRPAGIFLAVNAVCRGWFFVIMGAVQVIDGFTPMGESYWWLRLVPGVIELVLGG